MHSITPSNLRNKKHQRLDSSPSHTKKRPGVLVCDGTGTLRVFHHKLWSGPVETRRLEAQQLGDRLVAQGSEHHLRPTRKGRAKRDLEDGVSHAACHFGGWVLLKVIRKDVPQNSLRGTVSKTIFLYKWGSTYLYLFGGLYTRFCQPSIRDMPAIPCGVGVQTDMERSPE